MVGQARILSAHTVSGADVFSILPWCGELLSNLVSYDLVGLHTRSYMSNLAGAFLAELGGDWNGRSFRFRDQAVQLGVFPIGIDPTTFRNAALSSSESLPRILGLPGALEDDHRSG